MAKKYLVRHRETRQYLTKKDGLEYSFFPIDGLMESIPARVPVSGDLTHEVLSTNNGGYDMIDVVLRENTSSLSAEAKMLKNRLEMLEEKIHRTNGALLLLPPCKEKA